MLDDWRILSSSSSTGSAGSSAAHPAGSPADVGRLEATLCALEADESTPHLDEPDGAEEYYAEYHDNITGAVLDPQM
eukprot:4547238-Amphidinium_carterae.1